MVWLILSSQSCTCDLLTEIVRSHTIVNAEFALFAASCAVCPRLATSCAFGEPGAAAVPANLGLAQLAGHVTQVFVAYQQPEDKNDTSQTPLRKRAANNLCATR